MQPLYSVDHETRNNANREPEVENVERPLENTPLLHRFPREIRQQSPLTAIAVTVLVIILVAGGIIGIYLLVLQDESENVLPPVELPLQLVSRSQWDISHLALADKKSKEMLRQVTIVQTGTDQCGSTESCTKLLQNMQAKAIATNNSLPYNFLISSNGQTYEALGWRKTSPFSESETSPGLLLAFIGNFTGAPPTWSQLEETKNFLAASVSQRHLHPSYRIIGKNLKDTPSYLFQSLSIFPQWSSEYSDRQ